MNIRQKTFLILAACTALSAKEQRLRSAETSQESIRAHAESYGSSRKHVVVVLLNGGAAEVEVAGEVTAQNKAKGYTVANCKYRTTVPAGSEVKKKIKCPASDATDTLEISIGSVKPL